LLTSNRSVGEWGAVFGDPVVATAILDRLLHHSHVITIRGDSYRLEKSLSARSTASRSFASALCMARSLAACFTSGTRRGVNSSPMSIMAQVGAPHGGKRISAAGGDEPTLRASYHVRV
jgi:hypothetical protein